MILGLSERRDADIYTVLADALNFDRQQRETDLRGFLFDIAPL